jgi:WD40 repeat protein
MKIVYLDDDCSKLCDSQTSQGTTCLSKRCAKGFFIDHLERPDFLPKIGGRCMRIHPDGLSLAIGDRNGNIRILDLHTFKQAALVEAHDSEVLSVDYGQSTEMGVTFLASSSRDRFVHIFDASKDYQLVATLDDHSAAITAVRFTFSSISSHLQLISCSADKSLIFRSISKVILHR